MSHDDVGGFVCNLTWDFVRINCEIFGHTFSIYTCDNIDLKCIYYLSFIPSDLSLRHFSFLCFIPQACPLSKQSHSYLFSIQGYVSQHLLLQLSTKVKGIPERRATSALPSHHPRSPLPPSCLPLFYIVFIIWFETKSSVLMLNHIMSGA